MKEKYQKIFGGFRAEWTVSDTILFLCDNVPLAYSEKSIKWCAKLITVRNEVIKLITHDDCWTNVKRFNSRMPGLCAQVPIWFDFCTNLNVNNCKIKLNWLWYGIFQIIFNRLNFSNAFKLSSWTVINRCYCL